MKPDSSLPPRLREVLRLLAEGLKPKGIAAFLRIEPKSVDKYITRLADHFNQDPRISSKLLSRVEALRLIGLEYLNREKIGEIGDTKTVEDEVISSLIHRYVQDLHDIREANIHHDQKYALIEQRLLELDNNVKRKIEIISTISYKKSLLLLRGDILLELQWVYKEMLWFDELPGNISGIIKEIKRIANACRDDDFYHRVLMAEAELYFMLEDYDLAIRLITRIKDETKQFHVKKHMWSKLFEINEYLSRINRDVMDKAQETYDHAAMRVSHWDVQRDIYGGDDKTKEEYMQLMVSSAQTWIECNKKYWQYHKKQKEYLFEIEELSREMSNESDQPSPRKSEEKYYDDERYLSRVSVSYRRYMRPTEPWVL